VKSKITAQDSQGFHPEIRRIEKEIVAFFAEKTPEYTGRHPIIATVMAYFYIRRNLTQYDLQALTGFSAGTISKSVRQLVEINFITKETIIGTHKHIYKMRQLPFRSPRYFLRVESVLEKLRRELDDMKETLDNHMGEMQHLDGCHNIYAIITQLLGLLSRVPVLMDLIGHELEGYIERSDIARKNSTKMGETVDNQF